MGRPKLEPHLRRLLTEESVYVGALFQTQGGNWFTSLYAPDMGVSSVLNPNSVVAWAEGPTPEDAIHNGRAQLFGGL